MSKQYIVSPSRVKTTGSLSVFLRVKLPTTKDKTWVYSLTIFNGDVKADKNGGRCQPDRIPYQNSFSQDIMFKTELSIGSLGIPTCDLAMPVVPKVDMRHERKKHGEWILTSVSSLWMWGTLYEAMDINFELTNV